MRGWQSNIKDKQTNTNLWQETSCLEREDWQMKRINRQALSNNGRHTLLPPCFYLSSILLCSHLLLVYKPLCFDSALYLYFKWLNYMGSRGENYGCFSLFLSTGTSWPLPGSSNPPPPPLSSIPLSWPLSPPVLFSSSPTVANLSW